MRRRGYGPRSAERRRQTVCGALVVIGAVLATAAATFAEATPGPTIQRHGIPSGTPTPLPPSPTPTPILCDCDGDQVVSIHELVQGVQLALGGGESDPCAGLDGNRDGRITIEELVVAVLHALEGCAVLALPDAVFGANVFFGPARVFYGPAVVREDLAAVLTISVRYSLAQSISVSGYLGTGANFALRGRRSDLDVSYVLSGSGEVEIIDDTVLLHAHLQEGSSEPVSLRVVREMRGTPTAWSGDYEVELVRDGEHATIALTVNVPPGGFAQCDDASAAAAAREVRSGPCQIAPSGGFLFETALDDGSEIVLLGLIEDTADGVVGHGTWGERRSRGRTTGTWTALKREPGR